MTIHALYFKYESRTSHNNTSGYTYATSQHNCSVMCIIHKIPHLPTHSLKKDENSQQGYKSFPYNYDQMIAVVFSLTGGEACDGDRLLC